MWQRYNQGSHIFEKSLDNGASWVPMPINASSLEGTVPPSVLGGALAYTDRINTGHLTSVGTIRSQGDRGAPPASGGGIELFYQGGIGYVHVYDTAGSYPPMYLYAGSVSYATPGGAFKTEGNVYVGSDTNKGNLYTTWPIYPGRNDTGWTAQSSWYLGSHSSYGLFSNTGLYLSGSLWVVGGTSCAAISCASINTNGYGVTTGNLSITGNTFFACNIWHYSAENWQRLHFTWGGATYLKGPEIRFRNNSDSDIAIFSDNGDLAVSGSIGCTGNVWRSNIHVAGYVYPGRMTEGGGAQVSWFLAGHSSYGIYINTGLYMAGGIWCPTLYMGGDIYIYQLHTGYTGKWVGNCDNGNFPGSSGNASTNSGFVQMRHPNGTPIYIPYWY
jgi:hypothetical protein